VNAFPLADLAEALGDGLGAGVSGGVADAALRRRVRM
jgi:hypothetical protein